MGAVNSSALRGCAGQAGRHVGNPWGQVQRASGAPGKFTLRLSARAGRQPFHLGDIGNAVQTHVEKNRLSVVREYCGHGIGRGFHEDPQVLHYGEPGTGVELVAGMTITVEPMVNAGKRQVRLLNDGWTVVTKDHSLSAQWEHTVLVTQSGYEVLTLGADAR